MLANDNITNNESNNNNNNNNNNVIPNSTNTDNTFTDLLSDSDISKIIGLTVDIKLNKSDETITGVVFTLIKSNNMLILLRRDDKDPATINSFIINLQHLKEIKVSDSKIDIDMQEFLTPNLDKIFDNEKKNLEKDSLLKKSEKDNDNVEMYQKGHAIYEKFSKFYKCSYENGRISLDELDAFLEEPFTVEKLHCENESTKKRLIRMIESI